VHHTVICPFRWQEINLDVFKSLKAFVAVARLGSFTEAARTSGMTMPVVSRAISDLEDTLKVRLLHRSTRRVQLTDEGAQFLAPLVEGIEMIEACMSDVCRRNAELRGVIRIGSPPSIAGILLVPLIAVFGELHPDIEFDVSIDERHNEAVDERIDVSLRIGSDPEYNGVVRSLAPHRLVQCAAPAYLRRRGEPRTPEELDRHRCVGLFGAAGIRVQAWEFSAGQDTFYREITPVATFNEVGAVVQAARAGVGIAQLPYYLVKDDLAAGHLATVLGEYESERRKVMLCYPRRSPMPARVRKFIDFAVSHMNDELRSEAHYVPAGLRTTQDPVHT
jgi:LysR family transcriptional regulator, regulator for bpeEF and oprC